ncbi:DUF6494 family protein [Methylophaga sp. OBS1]|jgi:ribosomal protein L1|uniref:DUF6494 family protein n=1 Tax=Methylophaga sp. OBS1 TaxID=2991933 RepID=UPI0022507E03|nr:DUF6494 family protein [Methylophaga sp. OBS1]MCX4191215.1 DUF6494 family protein [Methylophaga sp. OBS1]MCX4191839.1 DUF6494 family protein [Methylophaga sp. OBS1]
MNDEMLNMDIRKFLKQVGVTSQREIEHAIIRALDNDELNGMETIEVKMTLDVPALSIKHKVDGTIHLS